jgi:hypothetical protein
MQLGWSGPPTCQAVVPVTPPETTTLTRPVWTLSASAFEWICMLGLSHLGAVTLGAWIARSTPPSQVVRVGIEIPRPPLTEGPTRKSREVVQDEGPFIAHGRPLFCTAGSWDKKEGKWHVGRDCRALKGAVTALMQIEASAAELRGLTPCLVCAGGRLIS